MKLDPNRLRKKVLDMVYKSNSGHIGGSFSIAELISVLYSCYDIGGKNKLILSKGHAVPVIYAALNELGKISDEELETFRQIDSRLEGHPVKTKLPFLDVTTGSLGQGLSIAIGHALAKKLKEENDLTFCILGDGELQEGQVWEAFMAASNLDLMNLVCFVDLNKAQNDGELIFDCENLQYKIQEFGWNCWVIDGHDQEDILSEIEYYDDVRPLCLILDTVKARGVSFMEGNVGWHCSVPTKEEYEKAVKELEAKYEKSNS